MNLDEVRAALLFGGGRKNGGTALQFTAADAGKHLIVGPDGTVTAAYAGSSADVELTDTAALQTLAKSGEAARCFAAGSLVKNTWIDTALGKSYDSPLRIVGFGSAEKAGGAVAHGMWLQAKYAHPFGLPFNRQQAILQCADGLPAGSYSFAFGDTVGTLGFVSKGVAFHFTLTQDVPAGGLLAGLHGCWEAAKPYDTLKIISYAADRKTVLETVPIAAGAAGADLGTLTIAGDELRSGIYRFGGGDNAWSRSALRQYLNSDKPKGEWWTPQSRWDLPSNEADAKDGYLYGADPALTAALCAVKVQTGTEVTYDKVIVPSLEQLYIAPQQAGEGPALEYYERRNGSGTPYALRGTYADLRVLAAENRKLPQTVRLRTAQQDDACRTWSVSTKGQIGEGPVTSAWRFTPMMFLGG